MGIMIVIGLVVLLGLILIGIYNRLVGLRQNCQQGLADIDAQLRQRHDLVPNLVATVQGYAEHEKSTLDSVIEARNRAAAAPTKANEEQLSGAIKGLIALGEAYPDLKASANFQALQGELADVEDKLAAARRALNAASANYNTARQSFPAVLFASALGFQDFAVSHIAADDRASVGAVPQVKF
ncbi:MAG: LemA family protein [Novosphingobium sp.]|uniref:LemA family protein n=1 Tax=Novosphingobium sp. TaxID=1874826 RepID=UPI003C7990F4